VASGSGVGSANCSTRHRKPTPNKDAASRRKRDLRGSHRLKTPSLEAKPALSGEQVA
jgi:hypothetical protein